MIDVLAVFETLVKLAFVATVQTVALEQIFDTRLYQYYLGKGPDGQGSRFFRHFELRPWISNAVGLLVAFKWELQCIGEGLKAGYLDVWPQVSGNYPSVLDYPDVMLVDMVFTGLVVGGGTKAIKKIAKRFAESRTELKQTLGA